MDTDRISAGDKPDQDKHRPSIVLLDFARALTAISEHGTIALSKYEPHGWIEVPNGVGRYTDAMLRHILLEPIESIDAESGSLHAVAVAWNALARLDLMLRGK